MADPDGARRRRRPAGADPAGQCRTDPQDADRQPGVDHDPEVADSPVPEDFDVTEPTRHGGPVHRSSDGDIGEGAD